MPLASGISPLVSVSPAGYDQYVNHESQRIRALCVGRHSFLSDHIARYFRSLGFDTRYADGLEEALVVSRDFTPDVMIAEYELLAMLSLEAWERDELLSRTAVIAVSLTRRSQEAHLLDINGIAGFLYMPLLPGDTTKIVSRRCTDQARTLRPPDYLHSAVRRQLGRPREGLSIPGSCLIEGCRATNYERSTTATSRRIDHTGATLGSREVWRQFSALRTAGKYLRKGQSGQVDDSLLTKAAAAASLADSTGIWSMRPRSIRLDQAPGTAEQPPRFMKNGG